MRGGNRTLIDMTGQKFGRLRVIERVQQAENQYQYPRPLWLCQCDCGKQTVVIGANLRSGMTKSCGCLRREVSAANGKRREGTHW